MLLATVMAMQDLQADSVSITPDGSLQDDDASRWTLVTAFSYSFFNHGFDHWSKESTDIYYLLAAQKLLLGAGVDYEQRSAGRNDVVYGINASLYSTDALELHGEIKLTDDADFLPGEQYTLGFNYRTSEQLELHFDIEQMEFSDQVAPWDDGITQIKPGVTWWFNENDRITLTYTHGWVHDLGDYDYYSGKFHFGKIIRDGTLSIGLAYGTDPDVGFVPGTAALSDAYLLSIFYTEPVTPDLSVFFGVEYTYRMSPGSNRELYQMWTPTIGLSWKF